MKRIYPHPILIIGGTILTLGFYGLYFTFLYQTLFNFEQIGFIGIITVLLFTPLLILWHLVFVPQCISMLKITETHVKYCGFLLPSVKLDINEINYIDIRTFKEGNAVYGTNNAIDAYKYLLLSSAPLPNKRIDKIRVSRKGKVIKFAVSYKLCEALLAVLPREKAKIVDYQMFLYKKAKSK